MSKRPEMNPLSKGDPIFEQEAVLPDFEQIGKQLGEIALEWAGTLLDGAAADVQTYVTAITADMANALLITDAQKRDAVIAENLLQFTTLAELNRIRFAKANMRAFQKIMQVAVSAAMAVLNAASGGLGGVASMGGKGLLSILLK